MQAPSAMALARYMRSVSGRQPEHGCIVHRASYTDVRKPRDGSGTVSAHARRTPPLKRGAGQPVGATTVCVARTHEQDGRTMQTPVGVLFSHPTHQRCRPSHSRDSLRKTAPGSDESCRINVLSCRKWQRLFRSLSQLLDMPSFSGQQLAANSDRYGRCMRPRCTFVRFALRCGMAHFGRSMVRANPAASPWIRGTIRTASGANSIRFVTRIGSVRAESEETTDHVEDARQTHPDR